MQGAEIEDEGSVLKYMTKSEIEEQRSSLLIMTQRRFFVTQLKNLIMNVSKFKIFLCSVNKFPYLCEA